MHQYTSRRESPFELRSTMLASQQLSTDVDSHSPLFEAEMCQEGIQCREGKLRALDHITYVHAGTTGTQVGHYP